MMELQKSKESAYPIKFSSSLGLDGKYYYQPIYDYKVVCDTMAPFIPPTKSYKIFTGIGSRDTPEDILVEITKFSQKMREKGWNLRSGAAQGADTAFEKGYEGFEGMTEIFLPWKKFNKHPSQFYTISEEAFAIAKTYHPNWSACNDAARKLLARNTYQVLGYDLKTPSDLVVCWTKEGKEQGGTSQAIRIAKAFGIKVVNLGDIKV
jgi:hypothetical protein